ncbi:hypothetical protein CLAIMM_06944 isoform 1 [Cladophialophora immunda]|nr:hypothetical protein CLAIMM_06944 isoform 1 [Cladophialophora immunda]
MPTLKDLVCHVQWADTGSAFPEYGTVYGDGVVETYIAIPSHPQAFTIRLTSRKFIYRGLAMVVFIDGNYQCNRNRVNLQPAKDDVPEIRTNIDFLVRQKEKPLGDGTYMGREWRFDDCNLVSQLPEGVDKGHFDELGTIEILVLRCSSNKLGESQCSTTSSAEHSGIMDDDEEAREELEAGDSRSQSNTGNPPAQAEPPQAEEQDALGGLFGLFDGPADGWPFFAANPGDAPSDGYSRWHWQAPVGHHAPYGPHQRPQHSSDYRPASEHYAEPRRVRYDYHDSPPSSAYARPPNPRPPPVRPERHVHFDYGDRTGSHPTTYHTRYDHEPYHSWERDDQYAYSQPGPSHHRPEYHRHRNSYEDYRAPPEGRHYTYDAERKVYSQYPDLHQIHGSSQPRTPLASHSTQHSYYHQPAGVNHGPSHAYGPPTFAAAQANLPNSAPVQNESTSGPGGVQDQQNGDNQQQQGGDDAKNAANNNSNTVPSSSAQDPPQNTNNNQNNGDWKPSAENNATGNGSTWANEGANESWSNNNNSQNLDDSENNGDNTPNWNNDTNGDNSGQGLGDNTTNTGNGQGWDNDNNHDAGGGSWQNEPIQTDGGNQQGNNGGGWGNENGNCGVGENGQASNGSNNQDIGSTSNNRPVPSGNISNSRSLYGPHGAYYTSIASAQHAPPAEAEEEPRYDVPQAVAQCMGITKQVQPGKGYLYNKKRCVPHYIDDLDEPYARFVFKYRTKEQLKDEIGVEIAAEPSPNEDVNALENLDKAELIQMVLRAKGALGGSIPSPPPKVTPPSVRSFEQVPVDPPDVGFLRYNLPSMRNVSNTTGLGIRFSNASSNQSNPGNADPSNNHHNWNNGSNNDWQTGNNQQNSGGNNGGTQKWQDNNQQQGNNSGNSQNWGSGGSNNNNNGGNSNDIWNNVSASNKNGWDGQQEKQPKVASNPSRNFSAQATSRRGSAISPKGQSSARSQGRGAGSTAGPPGDILDYVLNNPEAAARMGIAGPPPPPPLAPQIACTGSGTVGGGQTNIDMGFSESVSGAGPRPPTPTEPPPPCSPLSVQDQGAFGAAGWGAGGGENPMQPRSGW